MKHTPQQQLRTFAQMDAESRSITDDIQDFDDPESARDSVLAGRKRYAVDEPVEEVESEERETRRKAHAKVSPETKSEGSQSDQRRIGEESREGASGNQHTDSLYSTSDREISAEHKGATARRR